jgi:hypothetical protein
MSRPLVVMLLIGWVLFVFIVLPVLIQLIGGGGSGACWAPDRTPDTSITLIGRCQREAERRGY